MDISILSSDAEAFRLFLGDRWTPWNVDEGWFRPFDARFTDVRPDSQVWVRRDARSPWVLDVPFTPDTDGRWTNKRHLAHTEDLGAVTWIAPDGLRYARPEVTLMFKAALSRRRTGVTPTSPSGCSTPPARRGCGTPCPRQPRPRMGTRTLGPSSRRTGPRQDAPGACRSGRESRSMIAGRRWVSHQLGPARWCGDGRGARQVDGRTPGLPEPSGWGGSSRRWFGRSGRGGGVDQRDGAQGLGHELIEPDRVPSTIMISAADTLCGR